MSNKYYWHSRISERKFRQVVQCFAEDRNAATTAEETGLDRKSVNTMFLRIRRRILEASLKNLPTFPIKKFNTKKPYFVAESETECKRYSTKYKSRVLVVLFDEGHMSSYIIYAESEETFREIQILSDLNFENWKVCDLELFDITSKPLRVKNWNAKIYSHIHYKNSSGNLLLYLFQRIKQFKGITSEKFILHLKESEWRYNKIVTGENLRIIKESGEQEVFNLISKSIYEELLEIFRKDPL